MNDSIEDIKNKLETMISPDRFIHSLKVMEAACLLAERYGEDVGKARLAALLHDCAKGLSKPELFDKCREYGIKLDDEITAQPALLHGRVGAHFAEELFEIDDPEILAAIENHTMGREGMDALSCIVFVADYISADRDFPGIEEIRSAAKDNLLKAVVAGIDNTIGFILQKGRLLHPQTVATRNWALEKLAEQKNWAEQEKTTG